jgi:hypothetical protein
MSLVKDAGLESFAKTIGCELQQAPAILERSLNRVEHISHQAYQLRVDTIAKFRENRDGACSEFDAWLRRAKEIEQALLPFVNPESKDTKELQADSIQQLSFSDEWTRPLNHLPLVLLGLSLFKVWAVPALTILSPILAWVLPFLFLKFLYRLPISSDQYTQILGMLWSGAPLSFKPGPTGRPEIALPSFFTPRSMIQTVFFVFSFLHGIIQPVQNAMHLYKTDTKVYENGLLAIELFEIYKRIGFTCLQMGIELPLREPLDDMKLNDPRQAIHLLLEQPVRLSLALRDLAEVEILWRISNSDLLAPAEISETGAYPVFFAKGITDLSLPPETAVSSTVNFNGRSHHAALTGPNGGGKSSFLRGVLQCVVLGQAYGVAPAERTIFRRFGWISSGLRLQDSPGTLSMFETEVWFASRLLERSSHRGPGLVLYDEVFHSTNPPDGIKTAKVFLDRLWKRRDVVSIVSTHVFEIVEAAPTTVQRLCCMAEEGADGEIAYGFEVEKGICRISSVRSIWRRFGLEAAAAAAPENENLPAEKR